MLPGTRSVIVFCLCYSTALVVSTADVAAQQGRSNVFLRDNVSESRRQELTDRLQRITGWSNLQFDAKGALQVGTSSLGGSQAARALLQKAVSGTRMIIIDDASGRSHVAFGSVAKAKWLRRVSSGPETYVVMIDFKDFEHVIGDRRAREAFDASWALLHELDHAVNDSVDSDEIGEAGECESHVNLMRRELGLPERVEYFHTFLLVSGESLNFSTRFVRLAFDQLNTANKKKRYWLMWDAAVVGGSVESKTLAAVK